MNLGFSSASANEACSRYIIANYTTAYGYIQSQSLENGSQIYSVLNTPLSVTSSNGYYSNGPKVWVAIAGSLYAESVCFASTPTPTPSPTPPGIGYLRYTGATYASKALACADSNYTPGTTMYLNDDVLPEVGDIFYTDVSCTIPFDGGNLIYKVSKNSSRWGIEIGTFGTILSITDCLTIPTPTPTPLPIVPIKYSVILNDSVPASMSIVINSPSGSATSSSLMISGSQTGSLTALAGDYLIFNAYASQSTWP